MYGGGKWNQCCYLKAPSLPPQKYTFFLCLAHSSSPKLEAEDPSEMSVATYWTMWSHPRLYNLSSHSGNLIPHMYKILVPRCNLVTSLRKAALQNAGKQALTVRWRHNTRRETRFVPLDKKAQIIQFSNAKLAKTFEMTTKCLEI
jgi:hypothetical protein